MKLYKKLILCCIIVILLIPVFGVSVEKQEDMDIMMDILDKTEATFVEGDISMGGVILDRFIEKEEMLNMADRIREELNVKEEEDYFNEEEGFVQFMIQGIDDRSNLITFTLCSYQNIEDSLGETSFFVNVINNEQIIENNDIILKIEEIFDEHDKLMNVTTCIVGTINDNINILENEEKILDLTDEIDGKVIESYKDDGVLSFSIFTPHIEEYIYTGSKKMNLNIATRFNEYENKTYIWIGTPIITNGY